MSREYADPCSRACFHRGRRHCVADPGVLQPFLEEPRGRYHGESQLLVAPASAEETGKVLACCNRRGVGVVPVGGVTGLCGGTHTRSGEVLLSMHRQREVRRIDAGSLTAEAGCVLAILQQSAREAGYLFPLSLGSEGSCQLGGVLSTNAGGIHVLRYGMARDLVLGLEVALADGRVLSDLKPLVKDNTGYDVKQYFIGAEGTLGVITAATVRLFPELRSRVTALLGVGSAACAVAVCRSAQSALGSELNAFEIISRGAARLCEEQLQGIRIPPDMNAPWLLCMEVASPGDESQLMNRVVEFLDKAQEEGQLKGAVCAVSEAQRQAIWRLRHGVPEAVRRQGPALRHDLAVPPEKIEEFLELAAAICRKYLPGAEPVPFGHMGDGNLHYSVPCPADTNAAQFVAQGRRLSAALRELAWSMEGSFSAEHGIGILLKDELERLGDPVKLDVMRAVKRALDPRGIMNPGKVVTV